MFDDPAVRSVRVAVALCDRFEELLKGPTVVRSAKQRGALVGFADDDTKLSMRIGEAQQLYPEIWRHLDDAHTVFATRGLDLAEFDGIRAAEGTALGADVAIKHEQHGFGPRGVDTTEKAANFNRQGLGRARQAISALMRATPDIDWAAIAKAETADPAAADFARATRNKRIALFSVLALVLASPFLIVMYMRHRERVKRDEYRARYETPSLPEVPKLAGAELDAFAKSVVALRVKNDKAISLWPDAATRTAAKPSDTPCPISITAPPADKADRYIRNSVDDPSFAASNFYAFLPTDSVTPLPLDRASAQLHALERDIKAHTITESDRRRIPELPPHIVFVVIDKEVTPKVAGGEDLYTPGRVTGRAYVYSVTDAKLVCTGMIDAHNIAANAPGSYVAAAREGGGTDLLHREMEVRMREGLATGLRAVAP